MTADTPRTDALYAKYLEYARPEAKFEPIDLCRELERELAQAEEVIRECEPVIRSALDWFSHTKEERKYLAALDKLAAYRGGKNARS